MTENPYNRNVLVSQPSLVCGASRVHRFCYLQFNVKLSEVNTFIYESITLMLLITQPERLILYLNERFWGNNFLPEIRERNVWLELHINQTYNVPGLHFTV